MPIDPQESEPDVANKRAKSAHEDGRRRDGYMHLPHLRITVVHKRFHSALSRGEKGVEFRSPNTSIRFFPGLSLLFSLNASYRKRGMSSLVFARVSAIVMLTFRQARARFPREADDCNLASLMIEWGSNMVRCLVLDLRSIRIATEFVHLGKGCLGFVNQFALQTGVPHFCHIEDVGKLVSVVLPCGLRIDRLLVVTWPEYRTSKITGRGDGGENEADDRDEVDDEEEDDEEKEEEKEELVDEDDHGDDGCRRVGEAGDAEEEEEGLRESEEGSAEEER